MNKTDYQLIADITNHFVDYSCGCLCSTTAEDVKKDLKGSSFYRPIQEILKKRNDINDIKVKILLKLINKKYGVTKYVNMRRGILNFTYNKQEATIFSARDVIIFLIAEINFNRGSGRCFEFEVVV